MNDRFDRTLARLTGGDRRIDFAARRAAERASHQFAGDIGGASANYRAPYFGHGPAQHEVTSDKPLPPDRVR